MQPPSPLKQRVAAGFEGTGLSRAMLRAQGALRGPYIRALNYHEVTGAQADAFREQLRHYRRHFAPVGYEDLLAFHAGSWPHAKPGLLLTFDDGLRAHARVVAPLLEEFGMTGWFMVPSAVLNPSGDHTVAEETLTWEELRRLDGRHVIGCHTRSHRRLEASIPPGELQQEIAGAKAELEEGLGHEVPVFAWVGGEEWGYSAEAAEAIRQAGFRVSFMTNHAVIRPGDDLLQLQRTNVEADYGHALVELSLSGLFDLMYTQKRRRVNRLTASPPTSGR